MVTCFFAFGFFASGVCSLEFRSASQADYAI
jgi:hypothetical protein